MADPLDDLGGKLGLDLTDFKTGINTANRQLRLLESSFRAGAASLQDWTKDATGLESRLKNLTRQIDIQTAKVRVIEAEYKKVAAEKGANSKAAQDLQIKLNRENEALNKMQVELSQTEGNLKKVRSESQHTGKETDNLRKQEDKATDATNKFRGSLGGLVNGLRTTATGIAGFAANVAATAARVTLAVATMAVGVAVAIGGLAATTIGPASDLNETISKTQVVFGDAADEVLAFGDKSDTALGMSKNAALSAAGTYGNLFRAMGMTNEASADMSIGLVQLAGDLASFNNMDTAEVLEKLRAGLTGETEPLKALGVNINAAAVEAQAMAMGLRKVNGEYTAAQKAQATYALIMQQTSLAQGDFARTSGGLANQQRIFAAQIENLKAKIGTGLLPAVTAVVTALNNWLSSPAFQQGVETFVGIINELVNAFVIGFGTDGDLITGISNAFYRFGMQYPILNSLGDAVVWISQTVTNLIGKAKELFSAFKSGGVSGLFEALLPKGGLGSLAGNLGELIGKMFSGLLTNKGQLLQVGLDLLNGLKDALLTAIPTLLPMVTQLMQSLVQFITQTLPVLAQAGLEIVLGLVNGILPQLPALVTAAAEMIVTLANGIAAAIPQLLPVIAEIIPQVILALIAALPALIEAAAQIILALADGLVAAIPILLPYIPQIVQAIFDALVALLPVIGEAALELVKALALGIVANLPLIGETAGEIVGTLFRGLQALDAQIRETGASIVQGIWQGIQDRADWFTKQVQGFFAGIVEGVKKALGIASPSKVFADIGENMALGLGTGFSDAFRDIQNQVNGAIGSLGGVNAAIGGAAASAGSQAAQAATARAMVLEVRDVSGLLELRNLARRLAPYLNEELVLLRS